MNTTLKINIKLRFFVRVCWFEIPQRHTYKIPGHFQDFASKITKYQDFPGLSRTNFQFQDFPEQVATLTFLD